jgi:hypothetical protein
MLPITHAKQINPEITGHIELAEDFARVLLADPPPRSLMKESQLRLLTRLVKSPRRRAEAGNIFPAIGAAARDCRGYAQPLCIRLGTTAAHSVLVLIHNFRILHVRSPESPKDYLIFAPGVSQCCTST